MVRKINCLSISVLFSEIVSFLTKKRISLWIFLKILQNKERHSFAVCVTLCEEKQFLLIYIRSYWFDQKQLFKQIQIFIRIWPFSNMVRKTNFLSISVPVSEIVIFWLKRKVLHESSQKYFKTTEGHSLAVFRTLWEEKRFLLIYVRFYWFDKKQLFKQIQIFIRSCSFSNIVGKTTFWVFQCSFLR